MKKIEAAILAIVFGAATPLLPASADTIPNTPATAAAEVTPLTPPSASAAESGCGCATEGRGSCLHRLIEWATYCPKERFGCCKSSCNSCQYKGSLPIYLFTGHYCREGSGVHPTFAPNCCQGCKGCNGAP